MTVIGNGSFNISYDSGEDLNTLSPKKFYLLASLQAIYIAGPINNEVDIKICPTTRYQINNGQVTCEVFVKENNLKDQAGKY